MNRRHFIRMSGASLGALLINMSASGNSPASQITFPDKVIASTSGGEVLLTSADHKKWIGNGLEVMLEPKKNWLSVLVSAPGIALNNVQLEWNVIQPPKARYLIDHWERTYGDVSWQMPLATKKLPWYFMQYDGILTHCFGVKTGCSSICYWEVSDKKLRLTMDTRSGGSGVQLGQRKLHAADIITTNSTASETPFTTGQRFCKLMCQQPKLPALPVYGINDWYFAYGKNSSKLILEHTALLADLATNATNRPFSVIDAGWAKFSPLLPEDCCWQDDLSQANKNFADMGKLANDIKKMGMRPGLWTRPLCGAHNDAKNLLLPTIPGRDDPKKPVLDPTIDENTDRIKRNITVYKNWGFEMVKHDFSTYDILGKWGFEMNDSFSAPGWRMNDNSETNAEIMLNLYRIIRQAAGSMYLIGCNTISHLSAGLFELNRIGDDTSGNEWERTLKMGVNTLAFRGIQHNTFYAADADCVGLTNKVPWALNKQWMQLLAGSGTPLFISAQPEAVGTEQKKFIKQCFATAAKNIPLGEPLDWMESLIPSKWKLNGETINFDWS